MITIPDRITPIRAWRAWEVSPTVLRSVHDGFPVSTSWRLRSLVQDAVWPPRMPLVADCRAHPEASPLEGCICGIYALTNLDDLIVYLQTLQSWWSAVAVGPVLLWGTVIEHEHGYRAQYATVGGPIRLYVAREASTGTSRAGAALAHDYGVQVDVVPSALEATRERVIIA